MKHSILSASHRTRIGAVASLAVASVLLAACSSPAQGGPSAESKGGDVVVSVPYTGMTNLDPAGPSASSIAPLTVDRAIFDTLVKYENGKFVPGLATKWQIKGNQEFTFTLRKGVKFQDGTSFDAKDVKASIERVANATTPLASFWKPVTDIEVNSATSITLKTSTPRSDLMYNLLVMYIVPSELASSPSMATNPVGTGPFKVASFVQGESARLVPNKKYWGGAPKIDSLTFKEIPELSSRVTALKTGEVNVTWNLPQDQLAGLKSTDSVKLDSVNSTSSYAFWFNSANPALADANVRRALWEGIDFETMRKQLLPDTAIDSIGVMPANVSGVVKEKPYKFDPTKAKSDLEKAGFDFNATIEIQYKDDDFDQISNVLVSDWKKIGVKATAVKKDATTWLTDRNTGHYGVNLQAIAYPTYEPAYNISRLYTCAAKLTGFCSPELDSALANVIQSTTTAERNQALKSAQDTIWDQAVGMFPYDLVSVWGVSTDLKGFTPDPAQIPDFSKVYIQK